MDVFAIIVVIELWSRSTRRQFEIQLSDVGVFFALCEQQRRDAVEPTRYAGERGEWDITREGDEK
jgi:hypothetical protein